LNNNIYHGVLKMNLKQVNCKIGKIVFVITTSILFLTSTLGFAGNKRMMSIMAAKMQATRALVESIYGLKLRASESVIDMVADSYEGTTESKTKATIRGIKYEAIEYDQKQDIAKVVATVSLPSIENIDGTIMNLNNKLFRRTGYGTSTPANAGPLKALRAAELDGYKQLTQQIVGYVVESKTAVENFILKNDIIKTKVLATLYLAEVTDYGWEKSGDAFVNMQIDVASANLILGQDLGISDAFINSQGMGAYNDDFSK